ncbi:MAG: hypothetical protein QM496_12130 [Verrucomicrobiota bacterium]
MDKKTYTIHPGFTEWLNENSNGIDPVNLDEILREGYGGKGGTSASPVWCGES